MFVPDREPSELTQALMEKFNQCTFFDDIENLIGKKVEISGEAGFIPTFYNDEGILSHDPETNDLILNEGTENKISYTTGLGVFKIKALD